MDPAIAAAVFPLVFLGELPDKTMFASLVMASRGKPALVWLGAAAAFAVHVAIAVTVGAAVFAVLPHRAVDAVVAALFLGAGIYALLTTVADEEPLVEAEARRHKTVVTAFLVIFIAEWGDLTQILTANLAARYHSPLSVGVGALLSLWLVAALAVASGQGLLRVLPPLVARRITGVVLLVLAAVTTVTALR